jgi:hypothetical protein
MSQYYNVILTGGTSPGPYEVYYDSLDSAHVASLYNSVSPATGITYSQISTGVFVMVPNGTTVLYVLNTLCGTNVSIPVQDKQTTYDFCLQISGDDFVHFNSNGLSGGYQSWISDDTTYSIYFNTTTNKWTLSGGSLSYSVVCASPYPPLSGWYTVGSGLGDLISYSGSCNQTTPVTFTMSINQPTCECDGSISVIPSGGVPPYQFSIDNGVTWFSNKTLFNNLCDGNYSVIVKDSTNQTYGLAALLTNSITPVTYTVSLLYSTIFGGGTNSTVTQETATVNITPPLPPGVDITINLSHLNVFKSAPNQFTASLSTNSVLTKNGTPQLVSSQSNGSSTIPNTLPGCQSGSVYVNTITDNWTSITIGSSDVVEINTTTTVSAIPTGCLVANAVDTYVITNAVINRCSCCNVVIDSSATIGIEESVS